MTIPDNVTNIGKSAFYECRDLARVTIGNGVTSIGSRAFSSCLSLTSVVFMGKTLAQLRSMDGYSWGISDESIITVEP